MNRYLALMLICVFTVASCGGPADAGPTGTPAATSEVVYIVVTPIPPTPDYQATVQAALEATVAALPTDTAVPPTQTPYPTYTPTPSRTPSPTRTLAPIPTRTSTPAPAPTLTRQLATGTVIKQSGPRDGRGELTVENGLDLEAVAVLSRSDGWLLAVYIQHNNSYTITSIPDGNYDLFFTLGEDWDAGDGAFTRRRDLSRFDESFPFATTDTTYTVWSATLNPVPGGTADSHDVPEDQFPDLTP